ncbi:hypothetical protein jhhlp_005198 [Lomentospora prolificans]|uniref:RNA helicase n=1 Tax=Lomentospora prolificans TaxID=41688 RepID=A0A2N3N740_9PEZI|nr:hypothetical protein jhhlp_005198 [Lomentospora prolificans]
MDILKVLSRGIKKPSQRAGSQASGALPIKLPSAGTKPHPQLFHDQVGPSRTAKRKRNTGSDEDDVDDDASPTTSLPTVDFFAAKIESAKPARQAEKAESESESEDESAGPQPVSAMSEEECRQLLRSHRLKFSLLLGSLENPSRIEKKSKKKAKTQPSPKKDEKEPLYPRPLVSFNELRSYYNLPPQLSKNLAEEGYKLPTEVQMASLPLLLRPSVALRDANRTDDQIALDFMAVAPTGSGKTISFLIPAITNILRRREEESLSRTHELEAIVIAPTRELAFQIMNEGRKLTKGTGLRVVLMKKNMEVEAQQSNSVSLNEDEESESEVEEEDSQSEDESSPRKRPIAKPDILVTTPAPLLNFLTKTSKTPKVLPSPPSTPHLPRPDHRHLVACTNPNLRLTFWSATMGSNIEALVRDRLESHSASLSRQVRPLVRLVVGLKDTAVPNITHKLMYTASENGKLLAMRQLLRPRSLADPSAPPLRPPFLVFTQTIERAAALDTELKYDIPLEAGGGTRIASLHSGLSDGARASIMRRFRAGEIWVLITTDVLARGVDFAGVNGIVNYDVPTSAAGYVHRAGRTGRAGREGGVAITLYTKDDIPFIKTVANVIAASDRQAGKTDDDAGVQKWLLEALPNVSKADRKKLKERGVESRRSGAKAKITSKSGYDRRKERNKLGAIEAAKKKHGRSQTKGRVEEDEEWGGIED